MLVPRALKDQLSYAVSVICQPDGQISTCKFRSSTRPPYSRCLPDDLNVNLAIISRRAKKRASWQICGEEERPARIFQVYPCVR